MAPLQLNNGEGIENYVTFGWDENCPSQWSSRASSDGAKDNEFVKIGLMREHAQLSPGRSVSVFIDGSV